MFLHALSRTDSTLQTTSVARPPAGNFALSDGMPSHNYLSNWSSKRSKPKFPRLLTRTRSIRLDDPGRRLQTSNPTNLRDGQISSYGEDDVLDEHGLRTAPLQQDRSFRDFLGSNIRNRSADRQGHDAGYTPVNDNHTPSFSAPTVFKDGAGSKLFSNFKTTSAKAADGIGKAGKGLFGKITRSGNGHSKEVTEEENYVFSVIKLPLVEQTRHTRIAKRLEDSKDKTEFWMPALPWRCIE